MAKIIEVYWEKSPASYRGEGCGAGWYPVKRIEFSLPESAQEYIENVTENGPWDFIDGNDEDGYLIAVDRGEFKRTTQLVY